MADDTTLDYVCRVPGLGRTDWCPNLKLDPNDRSMESERYVCAVCGNTEYLYYEDMA